MDEVMETAWRWTEMFQLELDSILPIHHTLAFVAMVSVEITGRRGSQLDIFISTGKSIPCLPGGPLGSTRGYGIISMDHPLFANISDLGSLCGKPNQFWEG